MDFYYNSIDMVSAIKEFLMYNPFLITVIITSIILSLFYLIIASNKIHHNTVKYSDSLHVAIFASDAITTYKLVQKYPEMINTPNQIDGYTPFMRACLNGKTQLVRIMLNFGADIKLRTTKGETPFYLAVFYHVKNPHIKDASCIYALFSAGSDVNAANNSGYTPLQLAAMFGHTELVVWLLNNGACSLMYPDPYVLARLQGHYETANVIKRRRLPAIEIK